MAKYTIIYEIREIKTEIVEAKTPFGAWNKFKKKWIVSEKQNNSKTTRTIRYIRHEDHPVQN